MTFFFMLQQNRLMIDIAINGTFVICQDSKKSFVFCFDIASQ